MRWTDILTGVVSPPVCAACSQPLVDGERLLCSECTLKIPSPKIYDDTLVEDYPLRRRLQVETPLLRKVGYWTVYRSDMPVGRLIRHGKYDGYPAIIRHLARLMAADLAAMADLAYIDAVLPVPMHWSKRLRRGYNQAQIIAEELARAVDAPVADNLVAARRHVTQTRSAAAVRREAIKGTLRLRRPAELEGLHLAVVDDIITTGGTLTAAVETLLSARPASISIFTLAASM